METMITIKTPTPSATFSWLLGALIESSNSYRVLSIQELNPAEVEKLKRQSRKGESHE